MSQQEVSSQEQVQEFCVSVGQDAAPSSLGDFTKSEVERTRRFAYANTVVPGIGVMEDMRLLVKYDAKGNANCLIEYVEVVQKVRVTGGSTRVGLIDVNSKVLIDWEQPLFRECGRHARSFTANITRDIAEAVSGLQFRTVGSVPAQRC
jgi:hypothetical protein